MLQFKTEDLEEILNMNLVNIMSWFIFICDRFKNGDISEEDMRILMNKAKSHKTLFDENGMIRDFAKMKLGKRRLEILSNYDII